MTFRIFTSHFLIQFLTPIFPLLYSLVFPVYTLFVDEPLAKLTNILLGSFYSFLNLGLFLGELYVALKFVDEVKLEAVFKKATPLVRFVLALVVVSLASSLLNSFFNKYLSALLGVNPPLAKILQAFEALFFFLALYLFYRRGRKK